MALTAHVFLIDQLADWEVGHLLAELATGRFTGQPITVVPVAESLAPVPTIGGMHWLPAATLDTLRPADSDLLILPGGEGWQPDREGAVMRVAADFLAAGVPVAAICGATEALARAGLLDARPHTSAAREALEATGYAGGEHYVDERAVAADGLVTAGPQSPVQFARATLGMLGLMPEPKLAAYEAVFHRADPAGYAELMDA